MQSGIAATQEDLQEGCILERRTRVTPPEVDDSTEHSAEDSTVQEGYSRKNFEDDWRGLR